MNDRFRVANQLAQRLQDRGLAVATILQRAGLPAALFQEERILVSTAELFALWRAIAATSGDPAIGLRLGSEQRIEHYSATMVAAVCSRSLRDALQRIARFKRLTCPEDIRLRSAKGEVAVEFVFPLADVGEPDVMVDLCLAWTLSIGRRGTDGAIAPRRLELARAPQHRDVLVKHFACDVRFAQRRNALVFADRDIDAPFVSRNDDLARMLGAQLEQELAALGGDEDLAEQVVRALKRTMTGKRPTLKDVAQELRLSERTLQRRLTDVGKNFQQLAETARRELAHRYLRHTAVELNEVAYLLGYEDPNSFFRAFQQWEGTSPGAWRARRRVPIGGDRLMTRARKHQEQS